MKITQEKAKFQPITIVVESQSEMDIITYSVGCTRRKSILRAMHNAGVIDASLRMEAIDIREMCDVYEKLISHCPPAMSEGW